MGIDTSKFVDIVVGVYSCFLLTASIFSVKQKARSAAEKEDGERDVRSLRRGKV